MKTPLYLLICSFLVLFACSKEGTVSPESEPVQTTKYTITIKAGDGGTVSSEGGTFNKDSEVSVTATPNAEYLFEAWSDGSTDNPRTIKVGADLTITANFVKKQYDLTVNVVGEGAVAEEVVIQGGRYNSGSQIKLIATPAEGWEFSSWTGAIESTDNPVTVNINEAKEVTATFTRKKFNITVNVEGEGTYLLSPLSEDGYEFGSEVAIDIEANDEWYLDNVEVIFDCDEGAESCAIAAAISQALLAAQTNYNRIDFTIYSNIILNIYFVRDRDNDGVPDTADSCPLEGGEYIDRDGCPLLPIYDTTINTPTGEVVMARDWAKVGDKAILRGIEYEVVDKARLVEMIRNGEDYSKACVTRVTDMSYLFSNNTPEFSIRKWDVSNVTDMTGMFEYTAFNQGIEHWDVGNVKSMAVMFRNSTFNRNISIWDTSNVESMQSMFNGNQSFNQPIGNWNVFNVTNMYALFKDTNFNQSLENWDVINVTNMSFMFSNSQFNQALNQWDVSNVIRMDKMFANNEVFNQNLEDWDVGSVTSMWSMFLGCTSFNQDLSGWNVENVVDCRVFSNTTPLWTLPKPNFTNCTE